MTVNTSYAPVEYPGAGSTAPLVVPWVFGQAEDIVVVEIDNVTEAETPMTLGVHYTVTQSVNGGVVTPVYARLAGKTWRISRSTPKTQPDVLRTAGNFLEGTVERMFDRVAMISQEIDARVESGDMLLRPDLESVSPGKGSSLITHIQPLTSSVSRSLKNKLAEQVSVEDFGAVGDGVTDDTAAIQAAEDAVAAAGGTELLFKSTRYKISATLYKRTSNILWRGRGEGHQHDAGTGIDAASALVWSGAVGGTMIYFAPTTGASNRRVSGGGIVGIGLYGNDVAARGLDMRSVNNAKVDIYADGFTGTCMYMGVVSTLGEAKDTQQNEVRLLFQQVSNATGKGLILDGDSVANTSCNKIHFRGAYKFATALELVNCDNNIIYCWVFRFGGGTALGVDVLGGASSDVSARANTFEYIMAGDGGVRLRGTGDGYAVASKRNRFLMWDNDNTQPMPVVGTGCDYTMWDHDGVIRFTEVYQKRAAANVMDWYGNSDKLLLRLNWTSGTADSYIELRHGAGTANIRVESTQTDATLNLLTKGAGIGTLYGGNFASTAFQWRHNGVAQLAFYGTAPISKPTVTGAKGGNAALTSVLSALAALGLVTDSTT